MTIRIARPLASTLAIVAASWALAGCGDSGPTTTIPANTPPPKMTPEGRPMPPPTAAQPPTTAEPPTAAQPKAAP